MNNVDNGGGNKTPALSIQVPYTYSQFDGKNVALGTSVWKGTRFITIAQNDGSAWNWNNPVQVGLNGIQANTVAGLLVKLFNALYPECPITENISSRFIGEMPDITKLSHMYVPLQYVDRNGNVVDSGNITVGYKQSEAGPVIGISITSIRNGEQRDAFFPFKPDVINVDCQDELGNSLGQKLQSIQGQFLEFLSLFLGLSNGQGMLNIINTRKIHSTLMYSGGNGGNRGGGNNNRGGNGGNSNFSGGGSSYEDDIPF